MIANNSRTGLLSLPTEIIHLILGNVFTESRDDIISCSFVCKHIRANSLYYLFRDIYLTWDSIKELTEVVDRNKLIKNHLLKVKCIHIIKPTLYGEWHNGSDLLDLVEKYCINSTELDFTIAGSSSWCAYLPIIKQVKYIKARPKHATKLLDVVGNSIEFRIDDLVDSFPNVENISLNGLQVCFNRNVDSNSNPLPKLKTLTLEDCIWEYPNQIDDLSSITKLKVVYSTHHFTHSERLRSFAQAPPINLEELTVDIMATTLASIKDDSSPSEYSSVDMAWQPLLKHKCISLKSLELRGFSFPGEEFFRTLPSTLVELKVTCRYEKPLTKISWDILHQHKVNNPKFSMQLNGKYFKI